MAGMSTSPDDRPPVGKPPWEGESFLQTVIETCVDLVLVHPFHKEGTPGRFVLVNGAACRSLGYTRRELLERTPLDLMLPHEVEDVEPEASSLRQDRELVFEKTLLAKDGTHLPVEIRTRLAETDQGDLAVSVARDLTHRLARERELLDMRAALLGTLDGLSSHIAVLDEDGVIVLTNKAWDDFAGANGSSAPAVGPGVSYLAACEASDEEDGPAMAEGIRAVRTGDVTEYSMEYPCHSDTEKRWFRGTVTRCAGGASQRVVVAHEDITTRRRYEATLRSLATYLQDNREHERRALARSIHDHIGQGLAALAMDLAAMKHADTEADLGDIADRMRRVIDAVSEDARDLYEGLRPPMLDLLGLEAAIEWQLGVTAASTAPTCHTELHAPAPSLPLGDRRATGLFRVFQEALRNVLRHADATEVWVRTHTADGVVLEVEDDGVGVSPSTLDASSSLGFAAMRELMAGLGGSLEVLPTPGGGTLIRARVPTDTRD